FLRAGGEFFLLVLRQGIDEAQVLLVKLAFGLGVPGGVGVDLQVAADGRCEGGDQAVIVPGGDRVVLVIVAAGAADGQAEQRRGDGAGHVVEFVVALLLGGGGGDLGGVGAGGEITGGLERFGVGGIELVAGDL